MCICVNEHCKFNYLAQSIYSVTIKLCLSCFMTVRNRFDDISNVTAMNGVAIYCKP